MKMAIMASKMKAKMAKISEISAPAIAKAAKAAMAIWRRYVAINNIGASAGIKCRERRNIINGAWRHRLIGWPQLSYVISMAAIWLELMKM
jgi:hypothetical protein